MAHTVCIAAACRQEKPHKHCLILCSDAAVEIDGVAKGEIPFKAMLARHDAAVMFAGSVSKAKELVDRYIHYLNTPDLRIDTSSLI